MKLLPVTTLFLGALVLTGCGISHPILSYEAKPDNGVKTFYYEGHAIASVRLDSCYISLAVPAREKVAGYGHLKVWLLYQNLSSSPHLVTPWKDVKVRVVNRGTGRETSLVGAGPTSLGAKIEEQATSAKFIALLSGAIDAASVASSDLTPATKASAMTSLARGTAAEIAAKDYWYSTIRAGVSFVAFQKNTIFPGESANGYIYYPLQTEVGSLTNELFMSKDYSLALEVDTANGPVAITFDPVALE